MTRLQAIRLIAAREVRERTRSRVFRLGTFMTVLIVVAAVVFPAIGDRTEGLKAYSVGVVSPVTPEVTRAISQLGPQLGAEVLVRTVPTVEEGEVALRTKGLDLLVVADRELVIRQALDPTLTNSTSQLTAAVSEVTQLYAGLGEAGLTAARAEEALKRPALSLRGLEPAAPRDSRGAAAASSGMILLFVFLTLYGAFILNGVIEEKTSRVVEILLSCVRPNELLAGKVLGIAIVGTIQGAVLTVATLGARAATPNSPSSLTTEVLGYTLLWFIIGFGIYSWLYACAGALVSRSEDAQSLVFPLQLPLVASYVVGLVSAVNGPNPALTAMSFFPLTAPMTMLSRMSAGQVPLWEVLVSIGLCLITTYLVMRLAITVFAGGILRSGQRVKLRDAWRHPG